MAALANATSYPLLKSSNPRVLRVVLERLRESLTVVPTDVALFVAFPEGKNVSGTQQAGMAELHHFFLEEILYGAMDGLIAGTYGYSSIDALLSDSDFVTTVEPMLGGDLGQHWCHFVAWHFNHLPYRCLGFGECPAASSRNNDSA